MVSCKNRTLISFVLFILSLSYEDDALSSDDYNLTVDFGILSIGESVRRTFVVENSTDRDVRFRSAESSCECVRIISYPVLLHPHSKAVVQLQIVPPVIGEYAFEVFLKQDEPTQPDFRYLILTSIVGESETTAQNTIKPLDSRPRISKNPLFLKSAQWVREHRDSPDIMLIDIRQNDSSNALRIAGAVRMPMSSLYRKTSLRAKRLILINNGLEYSLLEEECSRLREKGFSVWILDGGTAYWDNTGMSKETAKQTSLALPIQHILPKDFYTEKNFDNWVIINASEHIPVTAEMLLPTPYNIVLSKDKDRFTHDIQSIVQSLPDTPLPYVLFYTEDGNGYDDLAVRLQGMKGAVFFFLDGGLKGYQLFWEQMAGSLISVEGIVRQPCPDCPKKNLEKKYLSNE
ncbi:hypothetical protein KDK77_08465 [bacterium]|nr:hypothetical protein [bacterium]MCP5462817.1 hypothetical protein [bacterium]MCP5463296.1 hypothetical protein [bacterium]